MAEAARVVVEIADPDAMHRFGTRLGRSLLPGDLVVLSGPLGAGKTTLSAGIGTGLGVRGPVTSPTFVLARTHPSTVGGPPLVHVDAYRLGSPAEFDDLDIDLDSSVVLVEWGDGMVDGLTDSLLRIAIERPSGDGVADAPDEAPVEPRMLTITWRGDRWREGFSLGE